MKAWQVHEWCEPEQMQLNDIALPEPQAGEVRIQTRAAALNFFDILQIQGKYQVKPPFPFTPGADISGTVDALGEGVTEFAVGDRVQASASTGGFAEYALAKAKRVFRIPDHMTYEEAAAMLVVYQTSLFCLKERGELRPGEWLLVHAGAGGVGSSAIQIGKAMGARVIATAGSDDKLAFCQDQGADFALSYNDEGWLGEVKRITDGHGADVIYDPVGGDVFDLSTKCIAFAGRLLVVGFAGGRIPTIAANRILLKNMSVVGCFWGAHVERYPGYLKESQAELIEMYEQGKIRPVVSRVYPLTDVVTALRDLAERRTTGKVVLSID